MELGFLLEPLARDGESRGSELARPFPISLLAISRHLRVLEDARRAQCDLPASGAVKHG
jgi:hypothetical protein